MPRLISPIEKDKKFNLSISDIYASITYIFHFIMGKQRAKFLYDMFQVAFYVSVLIRRKFIGIKNYIGKIHYQ